MDCLTQAERGSSRVEKIQIDFAVIDSSHSSGHRILVGRWFAEFLWGQRILILSSLVLMSSLTQA